MNMEIVENGAQVTTPPLKRQKIEENEEAIAKMEGNLTQLCGEDNTLGLWKLFQEKNLVESELGEAKDWPISLRSAIRTMMGNRVAQCVIAGKKDRLFIYNNGYETFLGDKHPHAMGKSVKDVWPEIIESVEPMMTSVINTQQTIYMTDCFIPVIVDREFGQEERYFNFCYSPLYNGEEVIGVSVAAYENTESVVGLRRNKSLRDLSQCAITSTTTKQVLTSSMEILGQNTDDFCFSFLYANREKSKIFSLLETNETRNASLSFLSGLDELRLNPLRESQKLPVLERSDMKSFLTGVIEDVLRNGKGVEFSIERFKLGLKCKKQMPINRLYAAPIYHNSSTKEVWGILFVGLNPLGNLKTSYGEFLQVAVSQIELNLNCAEGREEEKKRIQEMEELNQSKTIFFSNISHEFRTPLTLMFGPIEEIKRLVIKGDLAKGDSKMSLDKSIDLLERNTFRLYKLVNDLLEFSKVEAQKINPILERLDLTENTMRLVSDFKFICEEKGIELDIDLCPCNDILMDENIWERIVFNLVSNAFKYTLKGKITIKLSKLREQNGKEFIELKVEDTGCGISKENLLRLFERFYRVEDAKGRSHEGVGIGLSLVDQYVTLLGGTINVESELGVGSRFIVSIPERTVMKKEGIEEAKTSQQEGSTVQKLNYLLPKIHEVDNAPEEFQSNDTRPLILIVDDNTDMRTYVSGLLSQNYRVVQAFDGEHAMEKVKKWIPDLVLCDIMMPKVNGISFVKWLREQEDPSIKLISVVFLTAKTREGTKADALDSGADDFLVKPFSSEELFSRIRSHISLIKARKLAITKSIEESKKDLFLASLSHELRTPLAPVLLLVEELNAKNFEDKEVKELLKTIHQNIRTEINLIDDLLDFVKLSKGKMVFLTEVADVIPIVENAFGMIKEEGKEKGLELDFKNVSTNHFATVNTTKLKQIVWNLLRNAIKFTPRGGKISILVENADPHHIEISVSDSGIGLSKEFINTIFEPFNQGNLSRNHQYGGLGLGLNIAMGLTLLHHGTLRVESEGENRGSKFIVQIPTSNVTTSRRSSEEIRWKVSSKPINILLVEDNKPTLMVMNRILSKKLGHVVKTAESCSEAVEVAKSFRFDLLISDIGLPDKSGIELIKELRECISHPFYSVAATGYGAESDIDACLAAGFDTHITKPVSITNLSEMLAQANIPSQK